MAARACAGAGVAPLGGPMMGAWLLPGAAAGGSTWRVRRTPGHWVGVRHSAEVATATVSRRTLASQPKPGSSRDIVKNRVEARGSMNLGRSASPPRGETTGWAGACKNNRFGTPPMWRNPRNRSTGVRSRSSRTNLEYGVSAGVRGRVVDNALRPTTGRQLVVLPPPPPRGEARRTWGVSPMVDARPPHPRVERAAGLQSLRSKIEEKRG